MGGDDGLSVTGMIEHPSPAESAGTGPAADESGTPSRQRPYNSWARFLRELPGVIFLALLLAILIKTFLMQAFFIPSHSMIPTLEIDDRVLVSKIAYSFNSPEQGDVIVFDSPFFVRNDPETFWEKVMRNILEGVGVPAAGTEDLIKRVIAVGGDRLEIRNNRVWVNGVGLDEPYLEPGYRMEDRDPIYLPTDHVWVMGDNRDNSSDSRRFGPVPLDSIAGRAFVRVWPVARWGSL